ncbi:alpha/beta hydrolase [Microbacterium laevaniformans]|jgi:predicted alpha/beta-hydrolase family hydrolase|uniref:alpha/beta hydrolase family protein n=1 Tax=Microbacterium laevaniformans TaxID=36807 RepID=UPI0002588797|nr:alpha/beta family hydrolase [Microbacterium laevaniformans]EIC06820.1 hydrolase of the alpha/beta-hydrolase fold-containing protein [Microbacterium laevaniformans OR221]MBM7752834.1 putative alpha/beta-hydrolase family hydrolase [Microbacterium laevaniformans]GLJ64077.1 alpha/beta hydrolase [Microbacterium laevaniformans]
MEVALPTGAVEVSTSLDKALDPWAVMALAHGAGAGMDHPFLLGLAAACARQGVSVMRFAFPYAQAGRKMPGPASHAIATWTAVEAAARQAVDGVPFVAAGKSYGGRMASMAAADGAIAPAALVYLGYPLHPPGAPEKLRADHLPQITVAQLFVEGTNDPFIQPRAQYDQALSGCRDASTVWIDGGTHSFEVKGRRRPADQIGAELADLIVPWLRQRF